MTKDIKKFENTLIELLKIDRKLTLMSNGRKQGKSNFDKTFKEFEEKSKEIIDMYEELEEPKEKPVIKVIRLRLDKQYREENGEKYYLYSVISATTEKNNNLEYVTIKEETKEGKLITDDFIFKFDNEKDED